MNGFAEVQILNAAAAAAFAAWSARLVTRMKPSVPRIAIVSASIGAYECFESSFGLRAAIAARVAMFLICALVLDEKKGGARFAALTAVFAAFSLTGNGFIALLQSVMSEKVYAFSPFIAIPFFAVAGYAVKRAYAAVVAAKRRRKNIQKLSLQAGGCTVECLGFWDSGNTLYYKNRLPVIVLDGETGNKIAAAAHRAGTLRLRSVGGERSCEAYYIDRLILRGGSGGDKVLEDVVAANGNIGFDGFSVLLNCDLCG